MKQRHSRRPRRHLARVCGLPVTAALLRIDVVTLRQWCRAGLLPARQVGGRYLFDPRAVLDPFRQLPVLPSSE